MDDFIRTHRCNEICRYLRLPEFEDEPEVVAFAMTAIVTDLKPEKKSAPMIPLSAYMSGSYKPTSLYSGFYGSRAMANEAPVIYEEDEED